MPQGIRPTESRVREALFDIFGPAIRGARVLDLFAGSGAVGLEAASRGAATVVWVERPGRGVSELRGNLELLPAAVEGRLLTVELPAGFGDLEERLPEAFDLVFADPPYGFADLEAVVQGAGPLVESGGLLVLEHSKRAAAPAGTDELKLEETRAYGESCLSFFRHS